MMARRTRQRAIAVRMQRDYRELHDSFIRGIKFVLGAQPRQVRIGQIPPGGGEQLRYRCTVRRNRVKALAEQVL